MLVTFPQYTELLSFTTHFCAFPTITVFEWVILPVFSIVGLPVNYAQHITFHATDLLLYYNKNDENINLQRKTHMKLTTLCYIENDRGEYLMLHRTKKENDLNHDKWIGVGGKFEGNETPEECLLREVYEETGLTLTNFQFRGIVTFLSNEWEGEYMHLFTADKYEGTLRKCNEGELAWVPKKDVLNLHLWEGDLIFLRELMENENIFSLKLVYEGDTLIESKFTRYRNCSVPSQFRCKNP